METKQLVTRIDEVRMRVSEPQQMIGKMLDAGNDMIRFYLTLLNCMGNGFKAADMETAMNRTIDEEPDSERLVSQEFIDSFKMQ